MKINPEAPMGIFGDMTIDDYGTWHLPSCGDEGLPSITEVFAYVCNKLNVPNELRSLDHFTVTKMEPENEPKVLILAKK